jgi:hypothetical protein
MDAEELQLMIRLAMKVGNEITETADKEVEKLIS